MSEVIFTDQNFEQEVLKNDLPVLVDFWAPWCGPCQMMGPIIEELAKEFEGKIKIGKLDVGENQKTAEQYAVMSVPTLIFFKKGAIDKQIVGLQTKDALIEEIKSIVE